MARSAILNVMVQAAIKAGRSLARDYGEVQNLQVSRKGPGDFVSQADLRAEQIIYNELKRARPGYGFLMEERGAIEGEDGQHRWIVDPLDGTTNFLHSIPVFAISIALERQGQLVAGVIFNPVMDELYTAERGGGAFFNNQRMRVAARRDLADAVISTGIPHQGRGNHPVALRQLRHVMIEAAGVRRFGSAALDLAWVASGRVDGFWESGLAAWDVAAGALMVRESGGFVTDLHGEHDLDKSGTIVAGNEDIHRALMTTLKREP